MTAIPDKYLDLLERKKAFAALATTMPSPQVTPVWFDYKDGHRSGKYRKRPGEGSQPESRRCGRARGHRSGQSLSLYPDPRAGPALLRRGGGYAHRLAREEISRQGQVSPCCTRRSAHNVRNRARSRLRNGLSIFRSILPSL